jgi:hypothetical protein
VRLVPDGNGNDNSYGNNNSNSFNRISRIVPDQVDVTSEPPNHQVGKSRISRMDG